MKLTNLVNELLNDNTTYIYIFNKAKPQFSLNEKPTVSILELVHRTKEI